MMMMIIILEWLISRRLNAFDPSSLIKLSIVLNVGFHFIGYMRIKYRVKVYKNFSSLLLVNLLDIFLLLFFIAGDQRCF